MSNIIILSGKQFCGKDYTARLLLESLPSFCRIGLADAIKLEYSKQTGLSIEEIEKNKSTYRSDLIDLGNKGRAISPDYWINNILKQDSNVIVPDVRVPYEVEKFKENNAFCIRVQADVETRSKRGTLSRENDYTETALDNYNNWDFIIDNSDGADMTEQLDSLILKIKQHFDI